MGIIRPNLLPLRDRVMGGPLAAADLVNPYPQGEGLAGPGTPAEGLLPRQQREHLLGT